MIGDDHVRVGLGQVAELLDALAETDAEEAAGAERELGLHQLVAAPRRLVARVQERRQALRAVRLGPDHDAAERGRRDPEARQRAGGGAARDQHRRGDEADGERRAEVR